MDEQTTPKKVRRVGSIAFALVLIAAGILLIVYQFVPQFDLLKILKFSPVILIVNSTPFVRQYDILSNKCGVLLCQKEYQTNDIRRSSRKWL